MNPVMTFLKEMGCQVEADADGTLWTWMVGTRGRHCVRVTASQTAALIHVLAPLRVPAERRDEVRRLLQSLNLFEEPSCFELNESDGEVRCSNLTSTGHRPLSAELLRDALLAAVQAMDRHVCRIEAVVGGAAPELFVRP